MDYHRLISPLLIRQLSFVLITTFMSELYFEYFLCLLKCQQYYYNFLTNLCTLLLLCVIMLVVKLIWLKSFQTYAIPYLVKVRGFLCDGKVGGIWRDYLRYPLSHFPPPPLFISLRYIFYPLYLLYFTLLIFLYTCTIIYAYS